MTGEAKIKLLIELGSSKLKAGLTQTSKMLDNAVGGMKAKLGELRGFHKEAFMNAAGDVPMLGNALSLLGNPYTLIIAGLTAVIGLGAKATQMAIGWNTSMAKVNVTAGLTKKELKDLSGQILEIGARNTGPLEEVPEAFNKIISAGLDVKTSLATLEPTLQAAKAGFTDVGTVAAAAVNTMNSSGIMDATRVYDILFATLNKGNAEFGDIAAYLPKIIPGARAAGISLEDTAGAFAYLTAQGLKSEAAATGLQNVFKAFSNAHTIDGFKKIGVDVFDATGKMRPMLDVVKDLQTRLGGLSDKKKALTLGKVGLDQEAANTLASFTQNYEKLSEIVAFTNNSQGQLAEAVANSATPMDDWLLTVNMFKLAMIEVGNKILPYVTAAFKGIYEFAKYVYDVLTGSTEVTGHWGDLLNGVISLFSATWNLTKTVLKAVWGLVSGTVEWLSKLTILKVLAAGVGQIFSALGWFIDGIVDAMEWAYENVVKPMMDAIEYFLQAIGILDTYSNSGAAAAKSATDLKMGMSIDPASLKDQSVLNQIKSEYLKFVNPLTGLMDKAHQDELNRRIRMMPNAAGGGGLNPNAVDPNGSDIKLDNSNTDSGKASKVAGQSQQVRNITISFGSYIKGDIISQNNQIKGMSKEELDRWLREHFQRLLYSMEAF